MRWLRNLQLSDFFQLAMIVSLFSWIANKPWSLEYYWTCFWPIRGHFSQKNRFFIYQTACIFLYIKLLRNFEKYFAKSWKSALQCQLMSLVVLHICGAIETHNRICWTRQVQTHQFCKSATLILGSQKHNQANPQWQRTKAISPKIPASKKLMALVMVLTWMAWWIVWLYGFYMVYVIYLVAPQNISFGWGRISSTEAGTACLSNSSGAKRAEVSLKSDS